MVRKETVLGILVLTVGLGALCSCASPVEGAWEGRWELAQGADPAGYEVHLTLSKFMVDEPGGAIEYTIFHPDGRLDLCSSTLKGVSKEGTLFEYSEQITKGKCADGLTVRVNSLGEDALEFQRLGADGSPEIEGKLSVQTGIATAKGRL